MARGGAWKRTGRLNGSDAAAIGFEGADRDREEEHLQVSIVDWLRRFGRPDVVWWHTPNGEHRSKATGGRLKAMGVVAGVFDLAFILADGRPAFIELKRVGGSLSGPQVQFALKLDKLGVEYAVVANIDTALSILRAWGVLPDEDEPLIPSKGIR